MKIKHVYLCENSIDGIFTGIYDAWASRYGHENNRITVTVPDNYELFCEWISVKTDDNKALKVARSIKTKISGEAYQMVCNSALSKDKDKADSIYRFLVRGFAMGSKVVSYLTDPFVNHVFSMNRNVNFEMLHYLEFVRFKEWKNSVLFSEIRPLNDVLELIAPHFADRLTDENWIIYDVGRKKAVLHRAANDWIIVNNWEISFEQAHDYAQQERFMEQLWQNFVDTIGIEARRNDKLRLSMLPNRYREFMSEMPYRKQ